MTRSTIPFTTLKGRALFSLIFLGSFTSPGLIAAENSASKEKTAGDETMTVVAEGAQNDTNGYQPVASSTATLTSMPLLDIPQVVNTVSDKVLEDQHATTLDEALYNVANVVQTNTLGGTQDAFTRRGFGANRDGSIMTNGLRTVLPRSFNAATERVEVLKAPGENLWRLDFRHLQQLWRRHRPV